MVFRQLEARSYALDRQDASVTSLQRQQFAAQRTEFPLGLK